MSYMVLHNDPKHTSILYKEYSKTKEEKEVLTVMDFPPLLADVSLIKQIPTKLLNKLYR